MENFDIKVLFLLVAYPKLNPIEMVLGKVKRSYASRNLKFKLTVVDEETRKHLAEVPALQFQKYNKRAIKEYQKYKTIDKSIQQIRYILTRDENSFINHRTMNIFLIFILNEKNNFEKSNKIQNTPTQTTKITFDFVVKAA